MNLVNKAVETAARVLRQCASHVELLGPWRWQCTVRDEPLSLTASMEENFLELASHSPLLRTRFATLEYALAENQLLGGNVRFALDGSHDLHLRTEIVLCEEEATLAGRVKRALDGFRQGYGYETRPKRHNGESEPESMAAAAGLVEQLREMSWVCLGDSRVQLDGDSAPQAGITRNGHGLAVSVELVCSPMEARVQRNALSLFLLTVTGAMRLVRATAVEVDGQQRFFLEACLPPAPSVEEADHAMAALSTAHGMCTREANVLLDEAASRCYLSLREISFNNPTPKENKPWRKPKSHQSHPKSRLSSPISPGKNGSPSKTHRLMEQ